MTALLASVRSYEEALDAARAGADLIDLKEPLDGALGRVPVVEIERVVRGIRAQYPVKPLSATVGDIAPGALEDIVARVIEVNDTGVDYVKVGVLPGSAARDWLMQLATLPANVVPVLLCDDGVDAELADYAAELGFAGVVFDTASKDGRTLFDCVDAPTLAQCLSAVRVRGAMGCIAGSLGWDQLGQIHALAPDVAGFRTALCAGGRSATLDPVRVAQWAHAVHHLPDKAYAA
jgi:(5-formylfuran-3-yl)methyl phosphate synthase